MNNRDVHNYFERKPYLYEPYEFILYKYTGKFSKNAYKFDSVDDQYRIVLSIRNKTEFKVIQKEAMTLQRAEQQHPESFV